MDKYLLNLIPRIRAYGRRLNKIEEFADKTWVLLNESNGVITYRFKRNGILRKSINGDFYDLHWELEDQNSLAIREHRSSSGEIFKHGFLLDGILVVQKEGTKALPTVFYNESVIPDGDVFSYVFNYIKAKEGLKEFEGGKGVYFSDPTEKGPYVGVEVFDEFLQPVENLVLEGRNKRFFIKNGKIVSIVYIRKFLSDKGTIKITSLNYQLVLNRIQLGDELYIEDGTLPNGDFVLKEAPFFILKVENNKIIKVSNPKRRQELIVIGALLISIVGIIILFIIYGTKNDNETTQIINNVPDSIQVVADTNAAPAADTFVKVDAPLNEYVKNNLKLATCKYFEMINKRDWSLVASLFNTSVNYFQIGNLSHQEIEQKLSKYWDNMSNQCGVVYESADIKVESIGNTYKSNIEIVELTEKGIYNVPYIYISTMYFEFDSFERIINISSVIKTKKAFFQRMFNLDINISTSDFFLRNRTDDWESIFKKLIQVNNNTPSIFDEYKSAVLDVYGNDCTVEYGQYFYSLIDFMDEIKRGNIKYYFVKEVKTVDNKKIITVN